MWSFNAALENGDNSPAAVEARRVEAKVFSAADRVVVTTNEMQQDILRRFPEIGDRVLVIPNYVDTELFKPCEETSQDRALLFIGRIAPEKNLEALLEAVRSLPVSLTLIGEGKLRAQLQKKFADLDGRVTWEGNVPNSQLPERINKAGIFVLPSLYEGHPKTILEAMACGAAVVGADSPGIRELIRHRETGFLCGTDPQSIRVALEELLAQPDASQGIGDQRSAIRGGQLFADQDRENGVGYAARGREGQMTLRKLHKSISLSPYKTTPVKIARTRNSTI